MIALVLTKWPDKHKVKPSAMPDVVACAPSEGVFRTEITHNGLKRIDHQTDECWDIDVWFSVGGLTVRVPALSREGVNTAEMLYEMHRADNGTADFWVRQLIGNIDADALWERSRDEDER